MNTTKGVVRAIFADYTDKVSESSQLQRAIAIRDSIDVPGLRALHAMLTTAGSTPTLSALKFYKLLEQWTPAILFHLLDRRGPRNALGNGLQQSYGDHIRLLMHGLDKLHGSDAEWFKTRISLGEQIDHSTLLTCIREYHQLCLTPHLTHALWIAAALHDYGKLLGREYGLDAEDASYIAAPILDVICPDTVRPLVEFVIRNHDYIEGVFDATVPVTFIQSQIDCLPNELRNVALPFLGVIQLTGAASLGRGRLTCSRIEVYHKCMTHSLNIDSGVSVRLASLVTSASATNSSMDKCHSIVDSFPEVEQQRIVRFLDTCLFHQWSTAVASTSYGIAQGVQLIRKGSDIWSDLQKTCLHAVFTIGQEEASRSREPDISLDSVMSLLNGEQALVLVVSSPEVMHA